MFWCEIRHRHRLWYNKVRKCFHLRTLKNRVDIKRVTYRSKQKRLNRVIILIGLTTEDPDWPNYGKSWLATSSSWRYSHCCLFTNLRWSAPRGLDWHTLDSPSPPWRTFSSAASPSVHPRTSSLPSCQTTCCSAGGPKGYDRTRCNEVAKRLPWLSDSCCFSHDEKRYIRGYWMRAYNYSQYLTIHKSSNSLWRKVISKVSLVKWRCTVSWYTWKYP